MDLIETSPTEEAMTICDPVTTIDDLPAELLAVILLDELYLPPRWRFCARAVCRLWHALFDAAGQETRRAETHAEARHLTVLCRWDASMRPSALVKWRRGVYVCASAIVWWARQGRWDGDAAGLVAWCASIPGSSLHYTAAVLVATARPELGRHAVESVVDACTYTRDSPSRWGSRCLSRCLSRDDLARRLFVTAMDTEDIATVSLVCAALHPSLDWVTSFVDDLVVSDRPDTIEWMLRRFAAEWVPYPDRGAARLRHLCKKLWTWSAYAGSVRIATRLLALADGGAGGPTDADSPSTLSSSSSACKATTVMSIEASLDRACRSRLADCIEEAVCGGHIAVLDALAPRIDAPRLLRVLGKAVRAWHVPTVRWAFNACKTRGVPIDMDDMMARALNPYADINGSRLSCEHETLLSWLCDPSGGGYDPPPEAVPSLLSKAVGGGTVRCLFWALERWAPKLALLSETDVEAAVGLLLRYGCRQTLDPVSTVHAADACTLERLVHVLDALAAHRRSISCDMWPVLVSIGCRQVQGLDAVRHAWTRVTGGPLDEATVAQCAREPGGLAPARSWTRWCRVAPVSSPLASIDETRKCTKPAAARALANWLDQHGLLLPPA
ncbi:F-box incomplete domain containing protein [Pandoravirus celtis]|uniref:F-box incomplete domain containing protein n=1 Tax=Pandoravirus celtis TaxID=2568002 RepID=A0A4D6EFQ3_9VIRU|nr:F-box incomplete domain containing protein [Pandoravirus celtis]